MWSRRPVLVLLTTCAAALALAGAAPAQAGPAPTGAGTVASSAPAPAAVSPAATVVAATCDFERASADAVPAPNRHVNRSRGFVAFSGGTCPDYLAGPLHYFDGRGASWRQETSPYVGLVMAVAADTTGTFVLFARSNGVFVGKRNAAGGYAPAVRLSARGGLSGGPLPEGDIVALAGGYWAVWTEQVGPANEFTQTELFQAKTLGAGHCVDAIRRQRVTWHSRDDSSPSLVLRPASSGRSGASLAWSRNDGARGESGWLMFSRAGCDGAWSPFRTLQRAGNNLDPDLTRLGSAHHLAWQDDGRLSVAQISATYTARSFRYAASSPHIAASQSRVFVLVELGRRLASYEQQGGQWTLRRLTPAGVTQQAVAVTPYLGTFTAFGVGHYANRLYAITVS